jgi:hypothetical protein
MPVASTVLTVWPRIRWLSDVAKLLVIRLSLAMLRRHQRYSHSGIEKLSCLDHDLLRITQKDEKLVVRDVVRVWRCSDRCVALRIHKSWKGHTESEIPQGNTCRSQLAYIRFDQLMSFFRTVLLVTIVALLLLRIKRDAESSVRSISPTLHSKLRNLNVHQLS